MPTRRRPGFDAVPATRAIQTVAARGTPPLKAVVRRVADDARSR